MNSNIFFNMESIYVEYNDIIKAPAITLLNVIRNKGKIREIMDFTPIDGLSDQGLTEWYVTRKHINPFEDLIRPEVEYDKENIDGLLYDQLKLSRNFIDYSLDLKFTQALALTISRHMVKKVFIYSPVKLPGLEEDAMSALNTEPIFLYGDFKDTLNKVPNDSTYVLSDVTKVNILDENDKLKMNGLLIPYSYRYNYLSNDKFKFKVDFEALLDKVTFKYGLFGAI